MGPSTSSGERSGSLTSSDRCADYLLARICGELSFFFNDQSAIGRCDRSFVRSFLRRRTAPPELLSETLAPLWKRSRLFFKPPRLWLAKSSMDEGIKRLVVAPKTDFRDTQASGRVLVRKLASCCRRKAIGDFVSRIKSSHETICA